MRRAPRPPVGVRLERARRGYRPSSCGNQLEEGRRSAARPVRGRGTADGPPNRLSAREKRTWTATALDGATHYELKWPLRNWRRSSAHRPTKRWPTAPSDSTRLLSSWRRPTEPVGTPAKGGCPCARTRSARGPVSDTSLCPRDRHE